MSVMSLASRIDILKSLLHIASTTGYYNDNRKIDGAKVWLEELNEQFILGGKKF